MEKPSKEQLYEASDVCEVLADYIGEKWPNAKHGITTLLDAADCLETHAEDDEE